MRVFVGVVNARVRRFRRRGVVIQVFGYIKEHEGERDGVCEFLNGAVTLGRAEAAERARMVTELLGGSRFGTPRGSSRRSRASAAATQLGGLG
jgi:hypothetical protein